MYGAAMERLGLRPARLAIHDLDADRGDRLYVEDDAAEQDSFRRCWEEWVEGIRAGRFQAVADHDVCRACDFGRACRYRP